MTRIAVGVLTAAVAATTVGCGGGGSSKAKGVTGPNTQGVLITVLSYGRAGSAREVCPLLSQSLRKQSGGGTPRRGCGRDRPAPAGAAEDRLVPRKRAERRRPPAHEHRRRGQHDARPDHHIGGDDGERHPEQEHVADRRRRHKSSG